jgi:predicted nucleic acid-binding protein
MILVDAGPLVALVDASDQQHRACVGALRSITEPLGTVWPAISEAMDLLLDVPRGQQAVFEMLERKAVRILSLDESDVPRMRELMVKYGNRPMDLADAALVRVAEREGLSTVFTVDRSDFGVYRLQGRKTIRIIPASRG